MKEHHFEISAMIRAFVAPCCCILLANSRLFFVVCILWIVAKFLHEKKIPPEHTGHCIKIWVLSSILADIFLCWLFLWRTNKMLIYGGIRWGFYLAMICATQILWLIVRGIVAIVKAIRRKNEVSE